jgi:hypothetical protein
MAVLRVMSLIQHPHGRVLNLQGTHQDQGWKLDKSINTVLHHKGWCIVDSFIYNYKLV